MSGNAFDAKRKKGGWPYNYFVSPINYKKLSQAEFSQPHSKQLVNEAEYLMKNHGDRGGYLEDNTLLDLHNSL